MIRCLFKALLLIFLGAGAGSFLTYRAIHQAAEDRIGAVMFECEKQKMKLHLQLLREK